jgi:hypothetical protein
MAAKFDVRLPLAMLLVLAWQTLAPAIAIRQYSTETMDQLDRLISDRTPGGYASQIQFRPVGRLDVTFRDGGIHKSAGTGVLIWNGSNVTTDPAWVLTAASTVDDWTHTREVNVSRYFSDPVALPWNSYHWGPATVNAAQAYDVMFTVNGQTVRARTGGVIVHPNYQGNLLSGYNIALVRLDVNIPTTVARAATIYEGTLENNLTGSLVGYGRFGKGDTGVAANYPYNIPGVIPPPPSGPYTTSPIVYDLRKRAAQNVVHVYNTTKAQVPPTPTHTIQVAAISPVDTSRILWSDFDNPAAPISDGPVATTSSRVANLEGALALGDSGAPLFIPWISGYQVAGIGIMPAEDFNEYGPRHPGMPTGLSPEVPPPFGEGKYFSLPDYTAGDPRYGDISWYTRVSSFGFYGDNWIRNQGVPLPRPPTNTPITIVPSGTPSALMPRVQIVSGGSPAFGNDTIIAPGGGGGIGAIVIPAADVGSATATPEPSTWALLVTAAAAGLWGWRRQRSRRAA